MSTASRTDALMAIQLYNKILHSNGNTHTIAMFIRESAFTNTVRREVIVNILIPLLRTSRPSKVICSVKSGSFGGERGVCNN